MYLRELKVKNPKETRNSRLVHNNLRILFILSIYFILNGGSDTCFFPLSVPPFISLWSLSNSLQFLFIFYSTFYVCICLFVCLFIYLFTTFSQDLPNIFTGLKIFLPDTVKDFIKLKRYVIAYPLRCFVSCNTMCNKMSWQVVPFD